LSTSRCNRWRKSAKQQSLIDSLNAGTKTRARVFREIISTQVYQKFYNQSFVDAVLGYLRRDPDALYVD
jgi:hypothetical protein